MLKKAKIEEQILRGETVQKDSSHMLHKVLSNVDQLSAFITSITTIMDTLVDHQQQFMHETSEVSNEITNVSSITEETSASTEEVLATLEKETIRIRKSVQALNNVNTTISTLEQVIKNQQLIKE